MTEEIKTGFTFQNFWSLSESEVLNMDPSAVVDFRCLIGTEAANVDWDKYLAGFYEDWVKYLAGFCEDHPEDPRAVFFSHM